MFAFLLVSLASTAAAWGTLGHYTVALIAQNYISSDTVTYCQNILDDTSDTYLANVATWADDYRYTSEGSYSAPYHFIDAEDNPPSSCNVDYNRDCGSTGCSISALANYTQRVQDSSLSSSEVLNALKFIIHFVGDIHQPLHDEALDVGGNTVDVTFDGTSTNLHHIWDTNMPEQLVGGYSMSNAQTWATNLTTGINSGVYASDSSSWLTGIDISDVVSTGMVWATDSNSFVCTVVIPNGVDAVQDQELDGDYYDSTISTIELQIAKAGYRLAAWLNLIATGETGLGSSNKVKKNTVPKPFIPPASTDEYSKAKLARAAWGYGCGGHAH